MLKNLRVSAAGAVSSRTSERNWNDPTAPAILPAFGFTRQERRLETHGPLGTLWVSIGLGCFYIALIWLNTLLGFFLTPLFIIPATWVTDRMPSRRRDTQSS